MSEQLTKPFRGILYNREKISDITSCVCPPYDVITDSSAYLKRDEHNAIRLELPETVLPLDDKYETAKKTMDLWLDKGILVWDSKDAIYVTRQKFVIDGANYVRNGFICLNKPDRDRILTHEQTRIKAKEDRERLISTLKTYTSLIFGLYEDEEQEIENILLNSRKDTIFNFVDEQGIETTLYRMAGVDDTGRLIALMDKRNIYIADGHHRLDVSYRLGVPYIPMYLASMNSTGIVILPYHRTIKLKRERPIKELLGLAAENEIIEKIPFIENMSLKNALDDITRSVIPSYILYSGSDPANLYLLREKTPVHLGGDLHDSLKKLKVNILHSGILKGLLGISEEEISFTQEVFETVGQVRTGAIDLAVFLPPTTVDEVREIADNGLYMPPKSTFFYPKILTGLVFYRYG